MEELCIVRCHNDLTINTVLLYIEVVENGSTAFSSTYEEVFRQIQETNNTTDFPLIPFAMIFVLDPLRLSGLGKETASGVSTTWLLFISALF
jgi:hypothetical protein